VHKAVVVHWITTAFIMKAYAKVMISSEAGSSCVGSSAAPDPGGTVEAESGWGQGLFADPGSRTSSRTSKGMP
jgi:hypothetical protein